MPTEQHNKLRRKNARKTDAKATLGALLKMSYSNFPLVLSGVHPLIAPLIMFRLKRRGFSNCRVEVTGTGLIVYADR
ncbi:MAG: hypothetical protein PHH28_10020 [Desulfuromonadaceae bacterium]|nr:hypothetical protein [Desulfuromonadaceae bacterium]